VSSRRLDILWQLPADKRVSMIPGVSVDRELAREQDNVHSRSGDTRLKLYTGAQYGKERGALWTASPRSLPSFLP
jgi:hypothetical protein